MYPVRDLSPGWQGLRTLCVGGSWWSCADCHCVASPLTPGSEVRMGESERVGEPAGVEGDSL